MADTVPVLSAEERAELAEDHQCHPDSRGTAWETCWGCGRGWPCKVARLLATCDALEVALSAREVLERLGECPGIAQRALEQMREEATRAE